MNFPKGKEAAASIAIIIIVSENIENGEFDIQGPSSAPAIQCPKIQLFSLGTSDVFIRALKEDFLKSRWHSKNFFCRKQIFTWLLQVGLGFSAPPQTAAGSVYFKSISFLAKYLQRAARCFSFLSGILHLFCLAEFTGAYIVKIIFSS